MRGLENDRSDLIVSCSFFFFLKFQLQPAAFLCVSFLSLNCLICFFGNDQAMESKMKALKQSMEIEQKKMADQKKSSVVLLNLQQKQMEEDLAMRENALLKAAQNESERKKLEEEDKKLRAKIKASKLEYERQKKAIEEKQKQMEEKLQKEIADTAEEKRRKEKERRDRQKLDEQLIATIQKSMRPML